MKMLMMTALLISSQAALATTYNCDVPRDSRGEILMGGFSYKVDVTAKNSVLLLSSSEDTGHLIQHKELMSEVNRQVEASVYRAGDVEVDFTFNPMSKVAEPVVTLSVGLGSDPATAICRLGASQK